MNSGQLDVVIVTYNSQDHLERAAKAMVKIDLVSSVTVYDNGSTDLSLKLAAELDWGAPVATINGTDNVGFGAAVNRAARSIANPSEYLLLLNPDAIVDEAALSHLVQDLDANSTLGCVGAALFRSDRSPVSSARRFPTALSIARGRVEEVDHGGGLVPADWVCGALMLWRREAFMRLGGFSEDYFLYFEDVDICRRAQTAGWGCAIDGSVSAVHDQGHGRPTSRMLMRASRASRRRYAARWLGFPGVVASSIADLREIAALLIRRNRRGL